MPTTFSEPKTRAQWTALIKAMKTARAEDYPGIDPAQFTEFKKAITTGLNLALRTGLILLLLYGAFGLLDMFVWRTKHSVEVSMLLVIIPMVIMLITGAALRSAQRRATELGKGIGLIR